MPHRPDGVRPLTQASNFASFINGFVISVAIYPGPMALAWMLCSAHSAAMDWVSILMPPLAAVYGAMVLRATALASEPMLMILPPRPRAIMRRAASRPTWNAAVRCMSRTRRHSLGLDIEHRFAQLVPGVVDEDVDREALGVEMLESGADGRFVRDVERAR